MSLVFYYVLIGLLLPLLFQSEFVQAVEDERRPGVLLGAIVLIGIVWLPGILYFLIKGNNGR